MSKTLRVMGALVLVLLAVGTRAQAPPPMETWVESAPVDDCTGAATISAGDAESGAGHDVDADSDIGAAAEDGGPGFDAVWSSLRDAVDSANLSPGGVAHIITRHVIREGEITLDQSLTIRGPRDNDVIITADCPAASTPANPSWAFDLQISGSDRIVIENVEIRGFELGIDTSGSSGGTLVLRRVRIVDCGTAIRLEGATNLIMEDCSIEGVGSGHGIDGSGGAGAITLTKTTIERVGTGIEGDESQPVRLTGCRIAHGTTGIAAIQDLSLTSTSISHQSAFGVTAEDAFPWIITDSTIADNGDGLVVNKFGLGTANISIADSRIANNGNGLTTDNTTVRLSVTRSTVSNNAGDGLHLLAKNGSKFTISHSTIELNGADGMYLESTSGCTSIGNDGFEGHVEASRVFANADDGIDIGGTGSGCGTFIYPAPVRLGLLRSAITGNGNYGLNQRTAGSEYNCEVGENIMSDNTTDAENGTGGPVCPGVAANVTANQAISNN